MDVATVIVEGEHSANHRAGAKMEKKKKKMKRRGAKSGLGGEGLKGSEERGEKQ